MKYRLQFYIEYDEMRWEQSSFKAQRELLYRQILESVGPESGTIQDWRIEFPDANQRIAKALIRFAQQHNYKHFIGSRVSYTTAEIRQARFVPFLTSSDLVDRDRDGHPLNTYSRVLCRVCGSPDESSMPPILLLDKEKMRKRSGLSYGSNGIMVVSSEIFERLAPDIGVWVTSGPAAISEHGKVIRGEKEYVWMRPKCEVGPYIKAKVRKTCSVCRRPTDIRIRDLDDPFENIFEMNKHTVTSFRGVEAPIALVGNWCGEIAPGLHFKRSRDVIISGALHEKIRKMKLKGFVEADYVIHAADEPGHEPPE
jgi:hypothetical protein